MLFIQFQKGLPEARNTFNAFRDMDGVELEALARQYGCTVYQEEGMIDV